MLLLHDLNHLIEAQIISQFTFNSGFAMRFLFLILLTIVDVRVRIRCE